MDILDGRETKMKMLEDLKERINKLDRKLGLVVIQVGNDPASNVYVKNKEKMSTSLGINFKHIKLEDNVKEEELLKIIDELNEDEEVDGIIVQMPIPKHLNPHTIQNRIKSSKDIDGLTDINMGKLAHGKEELVPCTPIGIMDLLKEYKIDIEGKCVTIVGRSDLVGKPLAALMLNNNATVILCHSKTKDLQKYTSMADILVVAIGKPKLIKQDFVKENSTVIDVGINRLEDGTLCGDVDFDSVKNKVKYITPVPGGVGQMTVAEIGSNVYKAYTLKNIKNK